MGSIEAREVNFKTAETLQEIAPHFPAQNVVMDPNREEIAVIGMSCRFPGSNSPEEFWDFLCKGHDGITKYPSNRFTPTRHGLNQPDDFKNSEAGFLKCPIDEFDGKFFGISPREARDMSSNQRILLEVSWEALEDGCINPQELKGTSTGVFIGIVNREYESCVLPQSTSYLQTYLGTSLNGTCERLSYFLGLNGPNIAVESACSSSLSALHLACSSLKGNDCNLALAGGVNIFHETWDPSKSPFLSNDSRCKMFDASANGYVRAEGCGVIVLKRMKDAIKDGDNILCSILGSAINNDGANTASFGTPSVVGQMQAAQKALDLANVNPSQVSFIEAHGTGTSVGDPIEFQSLANVYGSKTRDIPLIIGSCKSNIGHAEAAAGVAGVIKVIQCLKYNKIPPNLHLNNVNPKLDFNTIPCVVPVKVPMDWNSRDGPRIAGLNSFALGGNNAHVIFKQTQPSCVTPPASGPSETQIVIMSAKTEESLLEFKNNFLKFLKESSADAGISIGNIVQATKSRAQFQFRSAICAKNVQELIQTLENKEGFKIGNGISNDRAGVKVGFLFTGQGCQYVGMGKELLNSNTFPQFNKFVAECDELFIPRMGGLSLIQVWNDESLLNNPLYCQPAIFALEVCIFKLWAELGVKPDYVLGHSAGEFAEVVCAGILSLKEAMEILIEKSRLVSSVPGGGMLAIKSNVQNATSLLSKFHKQNPKLWLDIAAINSPQQTVVSGSVESLHIFQKLCKKEKILSSLISTTHAFHSRVMDPIMVAYGDFINNTLDCNTQKSPNSKCNFISSVTGTQITSENEFGADYWKKQLRGTVIFSEGVKCLNKECNIILEIGPAPLLLQLAKINSCCRKNYFIFGFFES